MKVSRALGIWANNMYARGGHAFDGHYNPPVRKIVLPLFGLLSLIANLAILGSAWVVSFYSLKLLLLSSDNIIAWLALLGMFPLALLYTYQAFRFVEVIDEI